MHGSGMLLITTVAGYLVLERAAKQKNGLRRVGQTVGWFVIFMSVLGILCEVTACVGMGMCGSHRSGGASMCPFSGKSEGRPAGKSMPVAPDH